MDKNSPWRMPLVRELALVLALKLCLLYGLWWAFFSEPPPEPDAKTISQFLIGEKTQ